MTPASITGDKQCKYKPNYYTMQCLQCSFVSPLVLNETEFPVHLLKGTWCWWAAGASSHWGGSSSVWLLWCHRLQVKGVKTESDDAKNCSRGSCQPVVVGAGQLAGCYQPWRNFNLDIKGQIQQSRTERLGGGSWSDQLPPAHFHFNYVNIVQMFPYKTL